MTPRDLAEAVMADLDCADVFGHRDELIASLERHMVRASSYRQPVERPCRICGGTYMSGSYGEHRQDHPAELYTRPARYQRKGRAPSPFVERNAEIAAVVAEGLLTLEEIAPRYGLTRERIRQIAQREGVSRNHVKVPARPRWQPSVTCTYCGERVLMAAKRAHNTERGHSRLALRPAEVELVRIAYERGLGYDAIGRIFGVSFTTIKRYILAMGIPLHGTGEHIAYSEIARLKVEFAAKRAAA